MNTRTGSTTLASIVGIAGLLTAGFGSFAAYKSYVGGCGCCAGHEATPVVAAEEKDGCCALSGAKSETASCEAKCSGEKAAGKAGKACTEKAAECTGHGEHEHAAEHAAPTQPANNNG